MRCKNCGGIMQYDIPSYGLVCEHCGSIMRLPRPEEQAVIGSYDFAAALHSASTDWEIAGSQASCKSCGAQLFYESNQLSGTCPYCGSSVVRSAEGAPYGAVPNAIIPFTLTKEQVAEKFYRWNKFAFWSPEKFRKGKVLGRLLPVYIPYWSFDAEAVTTYSGVFGYTTGSGDDAKTTWYSKTGVVETHIRGCQVCGSRRFAGNQKLNIVTHFRNEELIPYSPAALSGMAAEICTVGVEEAWGSAWSTRLREEIRTSITQQEHTANCKKLSYSTVFTNITFRNILVPVWLSGCKYGGKVYNAAASGTNGRGVCTRPVSILKLVILAILILAYCWLGHYLGLGDLFRKLGFTALIGAFAVYVFLFFATLHKQKEQETLERERYDAQR